MAEFDAPTREGLQEMLDGTAIHRWLGFRVTAFDRGAGTLSIASPSIGNAERFDGAGQAHGGALASLADTTATFAASLVAGRGLPTMNLRIDFLRPAGGSEMIATATVRRAGRTVTLVDVEVQAEGKLVALGRATLATSAA